MGNVVRFHAHGKEYGLSVIDRDGNRWVTSQQVGEALGNKNIRKLIYDMQASGELKKRKHWRNVSFLQPGDTQKRLRIFLSWRGVIRVAMKSHGSRAREFRDWAEDVLFQVMVTGTYSEPQSIAPPVNPPEMGYVLAVARRDATIRGVVLGDMLHDFGREFIAKIVRFRRMGLTQREVAGALGTKRSEIQKIERTLAENGVSFDPVKINRRDKEIREGLFDDLFPLPEYPARQLREGGAE